MYIRRRRRTSSEEEEEEPKYTDPHLMIAAIDISLY